MENTRDDWLGYASDMVTAATLQSILEDVRGTLNYYPALKPLMRDSLNDYPSTTDTRVFTTIRQVLAEAD